MGRRTGLKQRRELLAALVATPPMLRGSRVNPSQCIYAFASD